MGKELIQTVHVGQGVCPSVFCDTEHVISVSGNALSLTQVNTGKQHVVKTGCTRGINVLTSCKSSAVTYAVSEKACESLIYVYRGPQGALVNVLDNGAEMGYQDLAISRGATRVAGITCALRKEIFVWDIVSGKQLARANLGKTRSQVSFSPLDHSKLCVLNKTDVTYWNLGQTSNGFRLQAGETLTLSPDENVVSHHWGASGESFVVTTQGRVYRFMVQNGNVSPTVILDPTETQFQVTSLAVIKGHLLVGDYSGVLRWLDDSKYEQVFQVVIAEKEAISQLELSPLCANILVSTAQGANFVLGVDISGKSQPSCLTDVHKSSVRGLAPVYALYQKHPGMIASIGQDQTFRLWDLGTKRKDSVLVPVNKRYIYTENEMQEEKHSLTAVASSPNNPFIVVGTECGTLELLYVSRERNRDVKTTVVASIRAHASPISWATFSPDGRYLATASAEDNIICLFGIVPPTKTMTKIIVLSGIVELENKQYPCGLCWDDVNRTILIATQNGDNTEVFRASVDSCKPHPTQDHQEVEVVQLSTVCLGNVAQGNGSFSNFACLSSGNIIVASNDQVGKLRAYQPGKETLHTLSDALSVVCEAHQAPVRQFSKSATRKMFLTGAEDGSISLWEDKPDLAHVQFSCVSSDRASNPITGVCFTPDGMHVVGAYKDGSITAFGIALPANDDEQAAMVDDIAAMEAMLAASRREPTILPVEPKSAPEDFKASAAESVNSRHLTAALEIRSKEGKEMPSEAITESKKYEKKIQARLDQEHDHARGAFKQRISHLQERLFALLRNNEKVQELEKLERNEFVVDVSGRDQICTENNATAQTLRDKIERENKGRELVFERIKAECWTAMDCHSKQIRGLGKEPVSVRNFPIPKQTPKEKRQIAMVKQLRTVELKELRETEGQSKKSKAWNSLRVLKAVPEDIDWIVNVGKLEPVVDENLLNTSGEEAKNSDVPAEGDKEKNEQEDEDEAEPEEGGETEETNETADGDEGAEGSEEKELTIVELLYHPATLRSRVQIRSQLVLLKQLQREMMLAFNKKFVEVFEEKEDAVERITGRYVRVNEILSELKQSNETLPEFWDPTENPESIFEISQEEIGVEKYLTKAERERLELEEAERKRREEESAKDNMGERALDDMMNGTLEAAKETSLADKELVRPEWMEQLAYEEMTNEQRKEYDEFEQKLQKFTEEKEKYTKSLEMELKKIRTEIADSTRAFDASLELLAQLKVNMTENVTVQELYIARLSNALIVQEDLDVMKTAKAKQVEKVVTDLRGIEKEITAFDTLLAASKKKLQDATERDRALERGFKVQIQEQATLIGSGEPVDTETFKLFTLLFKHRAGRKRISLQEKSSFSTRQSRRSSNEHSSSSSRRRSSVRRSTLNLGQDMESDAAPVEEEPEKEEEISLDPFAKIEDESPEEKQLRLREAALKPLDPELDCPEGFLIDPEQFELIQTLRREKIISEMDVKQETENVQRLQGFYDEMATKQKEMKGRLQALERECEELRVRGLVNVQDTEIIIKTKQGQDEVRPSKVISDYSHSLLLHRGVIEKENAIISGLGNSKVAIMKKMKDFRKSINYMEWEHKYMQKKEHDLEEHYTDLHMLRVTRGLQEAIKGGEVADRQEQIQKAENKISSMKSIHSSKMKKIEAAIGRVRDRQKLLSKENSGLSKRIVELGTNVRMRDAVLQARSGVSVLDVGDEAGLSGSTVSSSTPTKKKNRNVVAGSGVSAARAKMKTIVTRRKLMDLARAQADELECLKQELEQLRKRNFPQFSKASNSYADKGHEIRTDYVGN